MKVMASLVQSSFASPQAEPPSYFAESTLIDFSIVLPASFALNGCFVFALNGCLVFALNGCFVFLRCEAFRC